jgi:DNA-binding transcriptional LysR family regulator
MSNNRYADLETFVVVVEAGSFTKAAARMGRSKAGVSRQVKSLEGRLGAQLLHRTTRSLSLTEAGSTLYERASGALADLRDAESAVSDRQMKPQGRLRVSLPVAFGRYIAAGPLLELTEQYPHLELDLSLSDRYVDVVGEGFDLAVRIGDLADSSLIARRAGSTRRRVCASLSYLESRPEITAPADLLQHDCLLYAQQVAGTAWRFSGGQTVNVRGRIRSDSGEALHLAAIDGMGVAWLPDFYLRDDVAAGRLVTLLDDFEAEPLGIWLVYPHRRHLSLKVRLAVDHLSERLKSGAGAQGSHSEASS